MGKVTYKMSKAMYNAIRYPMYWSKKEQKMVKGKALTHKQVLEVINQQFGLMRKINVINFI